MSVDASTLREPDGRRRAATETLAVWPAVEAVLDRVSERLNPILVKEARQSLKSRQFGITFSLVLAFGWLWSLVCTVGFLDFFAESMALHVLWGYYVILTIPLVVVVPFMSFRSLAAEREDGTYELVSITTLSPYQVVAGKLGSAVLQMLVYFSALAPCIGFTYLLGEIDILTIGFTLYYLFLTSAALCVVALLVATITKKRHWQVVLSVAVILALAAFLYWQVWGTGWEIINQLEYLPYDNLRFWIGHLCFLTGYASYFVLFFMAAAASITFPSENRSTRLRVVMVGQQLLLIGWFTYYGLQPGFGLEVIVAGFVWSALHWYVLGVLMMGEKGRLSARARRSLPQSVLGRVFLTWFNPGPGTGYVLSVASLFVVTILVCEAALLGRFVDISRRGPLATHEVIAMAMSAFCYVVLFLGTGRLAMIVVRLFYPAGIGISILINIALLLAAILAPLLLQAMLWPGVDGYTLLNITNPFWTTVTLSDEFSMWPYMLTVGTANIPVAVLLLVGGATLMLTVQLAIASRELRQVRVAPPRRVQEDEAELHPPAPAGPRNPWEEG